MNQINFMVEINLNLKENIKRSPRLSDYQYFLECLDSVIEEMSDIMWDDPVYHHEITPFQLLKMLEIRLREKIGYDPDIHQLAEFTRLSEREITMFKMRFNHDGSFKCKLKVIANKFNLSTDRIRQINAKCIRKLIGKYDSLGMQKWGYI